MTTIDITPSPEEFVTIAHRLTTDLILSKVKKTSQDDARHVLHGILDIVRYLALVDADKGTKHLDAFLVRAGLKTEPVVQATEKRP